MKNKMITVAAVLLMALALPVAADVNLAVTCTSGDQTLTQVFRVPVNASGSDWTLPAPVVFTGSGGETLGTLRSLIIQTDVDPSVNLHFAVVAGSADTTFQFDSLVVSFAPLLNPLAYASAGITMTSDENGATVTGLFPGDKTYEARYNGSFPYADLVAGFPIPVAEQTETHNDRSPGAGYQMISGTVSSIESEFHFTLSALDQASGTSRFELTPEPATLSLLALGGLALLRRRK